MDTLTAKDELLKSFITHAQYHVHSAFLARYQCNHGFECECLIAGLYDIYRRRAIAGCCVVFCCLQQRFMALDKSMECTLYSVSYCHCPRSSDLRIRYEKSAAGHAQRAVGTTVLTTQLGRTRERATAHALRMFHVSTCRIPTITLVRKPLLCFSSCAFK